MQATLDGDFVVSWGGLDPEFRLAIVQKWISSDPQVLDLVPGTDRDESPGEMAAVTPIRKVLA